MRHHDFRAVAIVAGLLLTGGMAQSADSGPPDKGSAQSARAMLERAVAAVKSNEPKALADFSLAPTGFVTMTCTSFAPVPTARSMRMSIPSRSAVISRTCTISMASRSARR